MTSSMDINNIREIQEQIEVMHKMWSDGRQRRSEQLVVFLRQCFENADNCYKLSLELFQNSSDFLKPKSSGLAYTVMREFGDWLKTSGDKHLSCLNQDIKSTVLKAILLQKNTNMVRIVCDIYKLAEDGDMFINTVKSLILKQAFNEACLYVGALQLHHHFKLEEIVIPLILQDKVHLVEFYLQNQPELQLQLVLFLDSVFSKPAEIENLITNLKVHSVRKEKLRPKSFGKLLGRLVKLYGIPVEKCPNLCQRRSAGAFRYILYKKYIERSITDESYDEMVKGAVGQDSNLQQQLLTELTYFNDITGAVKWAKFYNIPNSEWPESLHQSAQESNDSNRYYYQEQLSHNTGKTGSDKWSEERWDVEGDLSSYLQLRLSDCDVHIVDTVDKFCRAMLDIFQNYDVVGLDAEWKPTFGISEPRISLLQMAVWDSVYLLDMIQLHQCLMPEHWKLLIEDIFCNNKILKLGYSIKSDLQMLTRFIPSYKDQLKKLSQVVDLGNVFSKFQKDHPELVKASELCSTKRDSKGLSELTRIILGQTLNKDEQFSDWERRPLRSTQITYAALDAFCLLQIYEELYNRALSLCLNIDDLIQNVIDHPNFTSKPKREKSPKKKSRPKPNVKPTCSEPDIPFELAFPAMKARDFKVVVDTMLQGLGRNLRICGVDTVILENADDHDKAAKIAQREDRCILTSGTPYAMLKNHVPPGMCFNVPCDSTAKEQAEIVFKYYNIQVTEDDLFTRCPVCNGNKYVYIPSNDLYNMWLHHQSVPCPVLINEEEIHEYSGGFINLDSAVIDSGVRIQLDCLAEPVFDRLALFYVCKSCGKVYWDGSHHDRIKQTWSKLLVDENTQNFETNQYGQPVKEIELSTTVSSQEVAKDKDKKVAKSSCDPGQQNEKKKEIPIVSEFLDEDDGMWDSEHEVYLCS